MSARSFAVSTGSALLLLGGAPLASGADEALAAEAQALLGEAVDEIEAILADENASPDEKRAGIEYRLRRWLDLAFISRAALGKGAEQFSREQYAEFAQEFGRYVVGLYVRRIAREASADFQIVGSTWNEKTGTVIVHALGGKPLVAMTAEFYRKAPDTAKVDYRLRKRRGEWRIVSISISGVDVVRLFREQFDAVLRSREPDEVIGQLRAHNARLEASNPFDS